jgi:pyruvate/2-oxoacid:ferredoxin oxidoreductase beta subunit
MSKFLKSPDFPYCKGCGHHHVARNTVQALEKMSLDPLDVVLVTDIGCHGIVDGCFATHTVHGLHGRSVALGAGIAMGISEGKKVIVYLGDGGATIGLQHLLEAARLNVDLTVVVHNNMVYGMTGGQPSGLTPGGFRTPITPRGNTSIPHDLCQLIRDAGAPFVSRVISTEDFTDVLLQGLETEGFALLEVLELCTSYGVKLNPGIRLGKLAEDSGFELGVWRGGKRLKFQLLKNRESPSILEKDHIEVSYPSTVENPLAMILAGSAGEGVQSAAEIFAQAAIASGLQVIKKGSYPVTVQVGFSTADLIISPEEIVCHAIDQPDFVIAVSTDGLQHNLGRIREMERGMVWIDASLDPPETSVEVRQRDFRLRAGGRNAALCALLVFVSETGIFPLQALVEQIQHSPVAKHLKPELLQEFL